MKKNIYLVAILGLVLVSACTPMSDINKEIDAMANPIVGDAIYTITDEDYSDYFELTDGSFSNVEDAKAMLPPFLKSMYPVWGKGSSVLVEYRLYVGDAPGVCAYTNADTYTLTQADYSLSGSSVLGFYPDATPANYLADILAANITSPEDGQIELVEYAQYTELPTIASSKVYFEEDFDYGATAGDLTTISGGNWAYHSGAANESGYAISGLSMTGYPTTGIGGAMTISSAGSEDVNSAFTPISSGKVYASTLVNLSTVGTGTYFFHFMDAEYGYSARVGAKDDGSGNILFGIGASSSTLTYGTTAFDLNTTYLIVSSYDIASGEANLYVLSAAIATEPEIPEATNTGNSGLLVQKIGVRQGSGGSTVTLDGIRVASSWASIMSNDVFEDIVTGEKTYSKGYYTWTGSKWEVPEESYLLKAEDFDTMGTEYGQPGDYNNFASAIPPDDYVPTFLDIKYPYALEGDELLVIYDYYSTSSGAQLRGNLYTVVDGAWVGFQSTISTTLQFGHDGSLWVPDNTIKFEFAAADYDYVVTALASVSGFESSVSNLLSYGNFSLFNWTEDQVDVAIDAVLQHNYPGMEDGQKFAVTIYVYDGSSHNLLINYILTGGTYVRQ